MSRTNGGGSKDSCFSQETTGAGELPSIFVGGAGFLVARGLLFPGSPPRREAIVWYGDQVVRLVVGVMRLLVVAGVIEEFVSPTGIPTDWKFGLAAAVAIVLVLCLRHGIRRKKTADP